MKRIIILWVITILLTIPTAAFAEVTPGDRLIQRPEWDGAIMPYQWVQGAVGYAKQDTDSGDATKWYFEPSFIASLTNLPLEIGARTQLIDFNLDLNNTSNDIDETGLGDIDIWCKYQFLKKPEYFVSAGLLLTLPTGSEDIIDPAASGEVNLELFAAGRYYVDQDFAVIGHAGLRMNHDADVKVQGQTRTLDGETQFLLGGGVIYALNQKLNLQGEINIATDAYDNSDNDAQLRGGVEYQLHPDFKLRSGLTFGLDDGAYDWGFLVGCAYTF
ncbi:MAG: transporter [Desulfatitalea sp.]|nr:transporter [Desulfatitalea sp.]